MKKIVFVASFMVVFGLVMAVNASAATYVLSVANTPSLGAGAFGEVEISGFTGGSAHVTFRAYNGYKFTDGSIGAINVSGAFSVDGYPSTLVLGNTNPPVDGFGHFNLIFNGPTAGWGGGLTEFSFDLHNTSGTWSNEWSVLFANDKGYGAAAHVVIANGVTGYVSTPIPGTVYLLGSGLAGLVGIGRWRRRK